MMNKRPHSHKGFRKPVRGSIWLLSIVDGPPGDWKFSLQDLLNKGADPVYITIDEDMELWLEEIINKAYQTIKKRIGKVTIIPDRNVRTLFSAEGVGNSHV